MFLQVSTNISAVLPILVLHIPATGLFRVLGFYHMSNGADPLRPVDFVPPFVVAPNPPKSVKFFSVKLSYTFCTKPRQYNSTKRFRLAQVVERRTAFFFRLAWGSCPLHPRVCCRLPALVRINYIHPFELWSSHLIFARVVHLFIH